MTTPIPCLQCGGQLGPDDRFCAQCGAELLWCASCGEFLLQAEASCPKCGTPGIPRPESFSDYNPTEEDSPWDDIVTRLRRATLGEFEIGHELGRGGMAAVFLAHELSLHRDVAIKVMSPGLLMGEGMIERFRREAITIAHLNHPNIVSVYSVRAAEGLHFFVMRCIQGRSLEQVLKDAGKLPVPMARSVLHHVGSALAYAHRFKVVHRDIKPANILLDEEGNAVVTDFGIAKAAEAPSNTHTGFMVGTPAYMSPEQCAGGEVSGASDQYSLGAVAYEMITGTAPFTGSTYSVIQAHVEQPPRPLREHCDSCPPELEAAVLRMLAKNPAERWPGMQQALTALGAAALPEDDPLRVELSRLAASGARTSFASGGPGGRNGSKTSAVLQVTPPGMMRAITILPPPPGLEVGDSFLLVARVHDGHAARLPTGPVEWTSSSPGVLRVNSTKAVATAITPGSALIRAVCDGNEGRLRVTVAAPRADSIVVKSLEKPITVADEVRLEATPRDKRGRVVARPVTWHSEDDGVATISIDGVLVARSGGTTQITAELDEARANVSVTVLPPRVAAVHISAAPDSIVARDSFALTATPLDRWAGPLNDRTVSWSVSDVSVAIVTAGGWVVTRNPGLVVLTAICEGVSASISVNVVEQVASPLPVATRFPSATAASQSGPEPWEVPPEPRIPEPRRSRSRPGWLVAAGGAFLVAAGLWLVGGRRQEETPAPAEIAIAATDTATAGDSLARPLAYAAPAESPVRRSVVITQRPPRPLAVGGSGKLAAEVRDSSGKLFQEQDVIWSSTNPGVAPVDSTSGEVRAVAPGQAQIVASSGATSDSVRILVRAPGRETPLSSRPASLSIAPLEPLKVGETGMLQLTAKDERGRPVRASRVTWSSSDPDVLEVNSRTGAVRANSTGSTIIIVRSGDESAIASVSVVPAPVASVAVVGARPLKVGDTLELRAEPRDARGRPLEQREASWSSNDSDVAEVDSTGVVIAAAPGAATISAASEGKSGSVRITVLPQPRTSRIEIAAATQPSLTPPPVDPAAERQRVIDQIVAGVDQCYGALRAKDMERVAALYHPATRADREKLSKLGRILQTREWDARVGEREDSAQRLESGSASMEFGFQLHWKDAFGGRLSSRPVFRAEFIRSGEKLDLASCRIVNSPKL
jgi:uncharacterized protein YjdB